MNLLETTGLQTVKLTEADFYSQPAIETAARHIMEVAQPELPLTQSTLSDVIASLAPWTPVHPKLGKITKRITTTLHKEWGAVITEPAVAQVGQYLATDLPGGSLTFDITDSFNWSDGEFGDKDSCFMHRPATLRGMERAGIKALRFYTTNGNKGIGRAWVAPSPVGDAVVFNAYGPNLEQFKARLKILLPNTPSHFTKLYNNGDQKGTLYINLGMGVLVGAEERSSVDLGIYLDMQERVRCHNCAERVRQGDVYTVGDDSYCYTCCTTLFDYCNHCSEYHHKQVMTHLVVTGLNSYAVSHLTEVYICEECAEVIQENYCSLCLNHAYNQRYREAVVGGVRQRGICDDCYRDYGPFVMCRTCYNIYIPQGDTCPCQK